MSNIYEKSENWDRPKLTRFKQSYDEALRANQREFKFEGHAFLTSYASYLIEYLQDALPL